MSKSVESEQATRNEDNLRGLFEEVMKGRHDSENDDKIMEDFMKGVSNIPRNEFPVKGR